MLASRSIAQRSLTAARRRYSHRALPSAFSSTTELTKALCSYASLPEEESPSNQNYPPQHTLDPSAHARGCFKAGTVRPHGSSSNVLSIVSVAPPYRGQSFPIGRYSVHPAYARHYVTAKFNSTLLGGLARTNDRRMHFSTESKKTTIPKALTSAPPSKGIPQQVQEAIKAASKAIGKFLWQIPGTTWFYLTHPKEFRQTLQGLWEAAKKEAHHYWMGSKLLYADVQTAYKMLARILQGSALTRRERKQLLRTVSDLFRLVPFSMFILIPFMEFALPLALRLFPNMLPSTFQDSLKAEENMKAELQSRIAMAQFFQETLQDLAKEQKKKAESRKQAIKESENEDGESLVTQEVKEQSAASMLEFLEKARSGEMIPPDVIIHYANLFQDDLTLDNMPRMQLINMCKYMSIPPYGADSILRFQLRHRIRTLKEDDQRILWEGINSLTKMELREACQERGMRSTGLSKDAYKKALQQWLDLSVNKNVPISLLIMSRTFFLREEMFARVPSDDDGSKSLSGLVDAISGLDKAVVNEVVLEIATSEEKKSDPSVRRIKLEVLESQNERILEEQKERAGAAKKKEGESEKEKPIEVAEDSVQVASQSVEAVDTKKGLDVLGSPAKAPDVIAPEQIASIGGAEKSISEGEVEDDHDTALSTQEMDALSQLINPDPVTKERQELERIKAAMKSKNKPEVEIAVPEGETVITTEAGQRPEITESEVSPEPMTADDADKLVAKTISQMDAVLEDVSQKSTSTSLEGTVLHVDMTDADKEAEAEESSGDAKLDLAIARLKSRVASMVDKIETQLTDVQIKIGDKLHKLDKDMDGILTREEMAEALQVVIKRDLSFEEAMDIASEMDENKDGFFTVAEFIKWIDTNKLVKLGEEGRDADMDRMMEKKDDKGEKKDEKIEKKGDEGEIS